MASFEQLVQEGDTFATQGKWNEAIQAYEQAMQMRPADPNVRRNLVQMFIRVGNFQEVVHRSLEWGRVAQQQGRLDEAIRVYHELLSLGETVEKRAFQMDQRTARAGIAQIKELLAHSGAEIFYNLGKLYLDKGMNDEAIEALKKVMSMAPQNARVRTQLGRAYMGRGMDKEATGEFQEVVRLAPEESAYAYEMLGEIYARGGKPAQRTVVWFRNAAAHYLKNKQYAEAIRAHERILDLEPENKDVMTALGELYATHGAVDKGGELYQRLAELYTGEGLLDKVILLYEKMVEWDPENSDVRDRLIAIYRQILDLDPSNMSARNKLIGNLLRRGAAEEAVPEFLALADTYLEKSLLDEGLGVCRTLLGLDPKNIRAHELLGEFLFKRGETQESMHAFLGLQDILRESGDQSRLQSVNARMLSLFPDQAEIHYQLAVSYLERELWDEAADELSLVLKEDPRHYEALTHLATVRERQQDTAGAIDIYQEMLRIKPRDTRVRRALINGYFSSERRDEARKEALALADYAIEEHRWDDAIEEYSHLLAYAPDDLEVRQRLPRLYTEKGDRERAVDELLFLMNLFMRQNMIEQALGVVGQLEELLPDDLNLRHRKAELMERLGRNEETLATMDELAGTYQVNELPEQAVAALERILALKPSSLDHRHRIISLLKELGRGERTIEHLEVLLRQHLQQGENEAGGEICTEIIHLAPNNLELRRHLVELYFEEKQIDEGMKLLDQLVQIHLYRKEAPLVLDLYADMVEKLKLGERLDLAWDIRIKRADLLRTQGQDKAAADEYLDLARALLAEDDVERSNRVLEAIRNLYVSSGRIEEGVDHLRTLSATLEGDYPLAALKVLGQVVEIFEQVRLSERALDILTRMAEKYRQRGAFDETLRALERRRRINADSGRSDEARKDALDILEMHLSLERYQDADRIAATLTADGEVGMSMRVAASYYQGARYDQALHFYQAAIDRAGVLQELTEEERRAIEASDGDEPLFIPLLGMPVSALPMPFLLTDAFEMPGMDEIMVRLIALTARQGNLSRAGRYLRTVLPRGLAGRSIEEYLKLGGLSAESAGGLLAASRLYGQMGFWDEAIGRLHLAAADETCALEAQTRLGIGFLELGQVELAEKQFQQTMSTHPDQGEEIHQELRYYLALAFQRQGKLREALGAFQECYAVDIRYRDVAGRIQELEAQLAG